MDNDFLRVWVDSETYPPDPIEAIRILQDNTVFQCHNKRYYPKYTKFTECAVLDVGEVRSWIMI